MSDPKELKYSKTHEWVRVEGEEAVVGITQFAQDALGDITYVEVPAEGDAVEQEKECGSVESVKAASDLISPVTGTVVAVNAELENAPEVVNQVAFNVIGNDMTITLAAEAGQLELNAFEPIIFYNLFQSIDTLGFATETFVDNCIIGITANEDRCRELVENSVGIVTTLAPVIGYQRAADLAKKALREKRSVREIIQEENILSPEDVSRILDPVSMTEPGFSG